LPSNFLFAASSDGVVVVGRGHGSGVTTVRRFQAGRRQTELFRAHDRKDSARPMRCRRRDIFESAANPKRGQAAVAQVCAHGRVASGHFIKHRCGASSSGPQRRPVRLPITCLRRASRGSRSPPYGRSQPALAREVCERANYNPRSASACELPRPITSRRYGRLPEKVDRKAPIFYAMSEGGENGRSGALNGPRRSNRRFAKLI